MLTKKLQIQIAGGLSIHTLHSLQFSRILRPVAPVLLLTGDCLTVTIKNQERTDAFVNYLNTNWDQVIYIPGRSELEAPGSLLLNSESKSIIKYSYRTHYPLGSLYMIIGATYITSGDASWIQKEEDWVNQTLSSESRPVLLASYCALPRDILQSNVHTIVQGNGNNQFDPTKPIVNRYRDYGGELRSDYNPEFVLTI